MQHHVEREQPEEAIQNQRHAEDHKKPEKDPIARHGKGGQGQQGVVDPADDYGEVPVRAAHDGMEDQGGDEAGGGKDRELPGGTPASRGIDQHHDGSDEPGGEPEPETGDEQNPGRRGFGGRGANE